jgi:hypothetical protein
MTIGGRYGATLGLSEYNLCDQCAPTNVSNLCRFKNIATADVSIALNQKPVSSTYQQAKN